MPGFALPDADWSTVRLKAYRQRRPVLIALLHSATCPDCRAWLSQLRAARGDLASHDVQPLLIFPDDPATLRALSVEFDRLGALLSDPQGAARARYLRVESADSSNGKRLPVLLIAVGRYNDCLDAWAASEPAQWPPLSELIATFAFAEQEDCACGLPVWQETQDS